MRASEAVDQACEEAPRNDDGGLDEKWVLDRAAELVKPDPETEARRLVKAELDKRKRPGKGESVGQLSLDGDTWPYEPRQIIADDDGHLIEKENALPRYTGAKSRRSRRNVDRVLTWARRDQAEHDSYTTWIVEQMSLGRPLADLRFNVWVTETGVWQPDGDSDE